jgi:hypothetical protein
MVAEVRFERTSLAYETKLEPSPVYSAVKLLKIRFRQMESNHLPIGYQPIARPESFAGMEPGVGIELTYPVYKTGASPQMLTRRTHLEPVPGIEPRVGRLPCGYSAIEIHWLAEARIRTVVWALRAPRSSH